MTTTIPLLSDNSVMVFVALCHYHTRSTPCQSRGVEFNLARRSEFLIEGGLESNLEARGECMHLLTEPTKDVRTGMAYDPRVRYSYIVVRWVSYMMTSYIKENEVSICVESSFTAKYVTTTTVLVLFPQKIA